MFTLLGIYSVLATIGFLIVTVLHFYHPYPLFQIPDRGHRLFGVPAELHVLIVGLLNLSGMKDFGTFKAGPRQTLFDDGYTVVASGGEIRTAAISIPVKNPMEMAQAAQIYLWSYQISSTITIPQDTNLGGKLVVLHIQEIGWDIAYRLAGRKMPRVVWEE